MSSESMANGKKSQGGEARLVVMRHFPTPYNKGGEGTERSRSWSRIGIDRETAEPLAEKAARIFDAHGVTHITSSDLPRAKQSMELVAGKMKERPEMKATAQARTWNTGAAGKPEKEAREQRKKYVKHPDEPMPGGESFNDQRNRLRPLIEKEFAEARRNPGAARAMVLHGHQVMDIENNLNGEPMKDEHWDRLDKMKPGDVMELVDDGKRVELRHISG